MLRAGTALGATLTGHKEVYAEMGVKELGVADLALLLLAMCFHSVFEGLAVGLSGTSKDVWKNTAAIVPHKVQAIHFVPLKVPLAQCFRCCSTLCSFSRALRWGLL